MSRSIGDSVADHLGVISTPIVNSYKINFENDYFIVAASDGVWDVFENQEVVNFVEYYRNKCVKNVNEPLIVDEVSNKNACIAQLLCEEARERWYSIIEQEDVLVDDISCVILELSQSGDLLNNEYVRSGTLREIEVDRDIGDGIQRSPTLNEVQLRDPRRGSIVLNIEAQLKENNVSE